MIIVQTIDNKMLQDTVIGVILNPFRPTLTENSSFVETRAVKNEYRKAEVEVLVTDFEPNEGVTDKTLSEDFSEYESKLKKNSKPDVAEFLAEWVKTNGTVKKGVDKKAAEDKAAKDAAAEAAKKKANA